MRNVARIKLGYYPLPHAEGLRLRKLLVFEDGASAVDPCAGTGAALHQLTEGADVDKHGVAGLQGVPRHRPPVGSGPSMAISSRPLARLRVFRYSI